MTRSTQGRLAQRVRAMRGLMTGSCAIRATLPLNPRLLCCLDGVLLSGDFMIGGWWKLQFAWLMLCVGALPCRAESEAVSQWKHEITTQLQLHQHFPVEACGEDGQTKVTFRIDRAGKLMSSDIVSGAGFPALDKAALEIVRSAQPFTSAPPEVADGDLKFVVIMVFVKPISCEGIHREEKLRSVINGEEKLRSVIDREEQLRSVINGEDKVRSAISGVCRGC